MTAVVDVRQLSFAYRQIPVLQDIEFQVDQGEFFIIVGPNGSGKTTLVKHLAGLVHAGRGRIDLLARPLADYHRLELARCLAHVPQMFRSDFPFTVREMVMMGRTPYLGILGIDGPSDREIADEAMRFTHVDHLAERKITDLSGGECQRVFIARAICQQPRIILLDEPTASLDLAHQVLVMDLMERLKSEEGLTIVMVSHDLNLAAMYADRLLLLKDGAVRGLGSPKQVLTKPLLEATYGCELIIDRMHDHDVARVTPVPGRHATKRKNHA